MASAVPWRLIDEQHSMAWVSEIQSEGQFPKESEFTASMKSQGWLSDDGEWVGCLKRDWSDQSDESIW